MENAALLQNSQSPIQSPGFATAGWPAAD